MLTDKEHEELEALRQLRTLVNCTFFLAGWEHSECGKIVELEKIDMTQWEAVKESLAECYDKLSR
jgi:hypothetical protein